MLVRSSLALFTLIFGFAACSRTPPAPPARPGDALPGLGAADLRAFEAGRLLFERTYTEAEGLGPAFNEARCASCHDLPTPGGSGADGVRKATRFADGGCDLLAGHGGDMLQAQITQAGRAAGLEVEPVPETATAVAMIMAPALYGAGLLEGIPDGAILALADPDDRNGDGISGRPGRTREGRVGRFGWKANFATVRDFVASAFLNEMGLTSALYPVEQPVGTRSVAGSSDPARDPEIDDDLLDQLSTYVRLLAIPSDEPAPGAVRDTIEQGRREFTRLGCAVCHHPELRTGASPIEPLNRQRVTLYSDLLLHDMGPENASVCAPGAEPTEFRTTPLTGLRLRVHFWHDGRGQSVEGAIRAHGGEAARARDRFLGLPETERVRLLRFLTSL